MKKDWYDQILDNNLKDMIEKDMEEIEEIEKDLSPSNPNNRTKISYELFNNYFLPLLTGEVKDENRPFIVEWISIAGSPTSEVEVLNKDGTSTIIPPLFNTEKITLNNNDQASLGDLISYANEVQSANPIKGDKLTNDIINSIKIPNKLHTDEYLNKWRDVLIKYGRLDTKEDIISDLEEEEDDIFDID